MLHVPVLRAGRPYRSLDVVRLDDVRSGEPVAEISQANPGLIARDLAHAAKNREILRDVPIARLLEICAEAAERFMREELPVDPEGRSSQSPDDYVRCLSGTTGMPHALCRANMEKIRFVLAEMERVLGGLTRGVDLKVVDEGWTVQDGRPVSYLGQADSLGVVLPSNSPGVHALWIPSVALKVPLVLKPGGQEPWTPMRIVQALIASGCPPEAFSVYPTNYGGASEILLKCERSMFFGDASSVRGWLGDPRVQIHGPGFSKILIGDDWVDDWRSHLDVMVASVAGNGGRSCVNASGIWAPSHGRAIAEALAERMASIDALPLDDPDAEIAAFSKPAVAHAISEYIDRQLEIPGAEDLTAALRPGGRVAERAGCTFLLPTVIRCDDPGHPLAASELLFPFVSIVECPQSEMIGRIGPTLVVSALTADRDFRRRLMAARNIDRLNFGSMSTATVSWDQPHEGNLFEHLYRQRAFQDDLPAPAA